MLVKIREVRGILNGTTNYILTKMFAFGASFEDSLVDAQQKGYAERNPDADILGIDACRKIAILTSLVTGKLFPTDKIHTEGITSIRSRDVKAAESVGLSIKLLGRCIVTDGGVQVMVAPFMLTKDSPLAGVCGVYNAVEVIGEPIGNLMFYGQGAGAGATASAVVGDLMQIMRSGRNCAHPTMVKTAEGLSDFGRLEARNYISVFGMSAEEIKAVFGQVQIISEDEECTFITGNIKESELLSLIEKSGADVRSRIRLI
nr:homoserine dehydrogenase [Oscillospiraceae bacterium]